MGLGTCAGSHACTLCIAHKDHYAVTEQDYNVFCTFTKNVAEKLRREFFDPDDPPPDYTTNRGEFVHSMQNWTLAQADDRKGITAVKAANLFGQSHPPLLDFSVADIVYDELHCLLRVMDRLLGVLLRQFSASPSDGERVAALEKALRDITGVSTMRVKSAKRTHCWHFFILLIFHRD